MFMEREQGVCEHVCANTRVCEHCNSSESSVQLRACSDPMLKRTDCLRCRAAAVITVRGLNHRQLCKLEVHDRNAVAKP